MNKEARTANSSYPKGTDPWKGRGEIPLPDPIIGKPFWLFNFYTYL